MTKGKRILAILAVVVLIVTGTYAMHQSLTEDNEFIGEKNNSNDGGDPVLHDDFDPKENMKDVYVENMGGTTLFVRVKLSEAMDLTDHNWRPANSGELIPHVYDPTARNCSHSNAAGKLFHDYFAWNMGGWKYYKPASGQVGKVNDKNVYTEADFNDPSKGISKTPDAQITTVSAFLAMDSAEQNAFIGWIYDTDGYAYWSQPLKPKDATGLLLHGVITSPSLENTEYYYVINVLVESVDREDIPMWTEGKESSDGEGGKMDEATEGGKEVINIIVGNADDSEDNNGGGDNGGGDGNGGDNSGGSDGGSEDDNGGGDGGDPVDNKTIAVKTPSDADMGYRSRITGTREDESCWFTSRDKLTTAVLDEPGAFRLEDILVDMNDADGLKVTPVESKYNGMFSIGSARTKTCPERDDKLSILYTVIPEKSVAAAQWNADRDTVYPIKTQLNLETKDGRTALITVTMEYRFGFIAWEY